MGPEKIVRRNVAGGGINRRFDACWIWGLKQTVRPMCRECGAAPFILHFLIMGRIGHSRELLTQAVRTEAV